MDYNLTKTQENIRAEFETMLQFVTSEEAQTTTADHMERHLFQLLLSLGAQLLLLFFQMRSQICVREPITSEGQAVLYHSEQKRVYFSIFGKIPVWRPYFYRLGTGGHTPLDAELSLGADCYSDLLREMLEYLGVYMSFNKAVDMLKRILQLSISTRVQQKFVSEDADDVLAYYEQKAVPKAINEAEILVIQADGKGVPIILKTRLLSLYAWEKDKNEDEKRKLSSRPCTQLRGICARRKMLSIAFSNRMKMTNRTTYPHQNRKTNILGRH